MQNEHLTTVGLMNPRVQVFCSDALETDATEFAGRWVDLSADYFSQNANSTAMRLLCAALCRNSLEERGIHSRFSHSAPTQMTDARYSRLLNSRLLNKFRPKMEAYIALQGDRLSMDHVYECFRDETPVYKLPYVAV